MREAGFHRRDLLRAALWSAGLGLAQVVPGLAWATAGPLTRAIPASGERLPVVGLGANTFGIGYPKALATRRQMLAGLVQTPGCVIDTAQAYGRSEQVLGDLIAELGVRDKVFLATKTPMGGDSSPADEMLENSFRNLRVERIDLIQVHNLYRYRELLPVFERARKAGRVRYVGVSSPVSGFPELMELMRRQKLDFIQIEYSLPTRRAAEPVLALARERGIAVLAGEPFGGRMRAGSVFNRLNQRALPGWAAELDADSWAQVLLKYVIAHPAVTAVIPGSSRLPHLRDNLGAAYGRLPDAALRQKVEQYWDSV